MKLLNVIVDFYVKNNFISEEKKEFFALGLKLISGAILNYGIIFIISLLFSELIYGFIFIACFYFSRIFCGGYHARTEQRCRLTFIGTFILLLFMENLSPTPWLFPMMILSNVITLLTVTKLAPVEHPNKPLTQDEAKDGKKKGIFVVCFFIFSELILFNFFRSESFMIALTLLAVAVLMPIGIYSNRKEVI